MANNDNSDEKKRASYKIGEWIGVSMLVLVLLLLAAVVIKVIALMFGIGN